MCLGLEKEVKNDIKFCASHLLFVQKLGFPILFAGYLILKIQEVE